jgi:excinuclease ABC subunit C
VQSLQRDLRLKNPPRRIECFDNSNIQGSDPVSSMVSFVDGRPRRSEYRKYRVRTVEGPNDFATMKEVVGRRYSRVLREGWALPDLIVIDGGKGQVSAAGEVLRELGLEHIPMIGLAKRLEEIVIPGERDTLLLPKSSSSLRLLQQIRDEAHRFAITYHRSLRARRTLQSELTNIPGIGPKTVVKIFERFGSVRGVEAASPDDLQEVLGPKTGRNVYDYFAARRQAEAREAVAGDAREDAPEDFDDVQLLDDEEDARSDGDGDDEEDARAESDGDDDEGEIDERDLEPREGDEPEEML